MEKVSLSIIIPAFNEQKNLEKGVLKEVQNYLDKQKYSYEVLIVDDGSKDKTVELIDDQIKNRKNYRLIQNNHSGKAVAVMTGMLESKGEIGLFTDMDQATPLKEIEKLIPLFEQDFDIVIGSRKGRQGAPVIRKLMAWGFATMRTLILGLDFADTQCGFKAFNRSAIDKVFSPLLLKWKSHSAKGAAVNAGFDVETLYLAKKKGLKISEVPVEWHYVGSERVQAISDSIDAIRDMIRIRLDDWDGKYN